MNNKNYLIVFLMHAFSFLGYTQVGTIMGNMEVQFQYLNQDSLIGANQPPSKGLLNSYTNVFYSHENFKAGLRIESYLPRIQGYPAEFEGTGLGMRYLGYSNSLIDITAGHFYEQFGSGLSLRAYEDRALGYDNALDGIRIKFYPHKAINIKGIYGRQRLAFRNQVINSEGFVRGADAELSINDLLPSWSNKAFSITLGGSLASKFQPSNHDQLILPENVGTYGGRIALGYKGFFLEAEYVEKGQDPSQDNNYIYNKGTATVFNARYTRKGLGVLLSAKSVDNMSFRSDRTKIMQTGLINYLPALNKTHTYNLVSSLYPYATQPTGEIAVQAEIVYTIPRTSPLGGKYGTSIQANISTAYQPKRKENPTFATDSSGIAYTTRPFSLSDSLYWLDININISRKLSRKFHAVLNYYYIALNNDVAAVSKQPGVISSNIFILETSYKLKKQSSLRAEFQLLIINRIDSLNRRVSMHSDGYKRASDNGDWATFVLEYTLSSHWMISIMDQYNFGHYNKSQRIHHPYFTLGYIVGPTRLMASYGRQRAGMFCVGGVCRFVPASNGLTVSLTHSF